MLGMLFRIQLNVMFLIVMLLMLLTTWFWCPKNVAGNIWGNDFIETLDEKMLSKVKSCPSDSKFKFGGIQINHYMQKTYQYYLLLNDLP